MDCIKKFDILLCSREVLKNKIPVKNDESALKTCEEAVDLRKDLDELETIKEKIAHIIEDIFQTLNDGNVTPQFILVLQKKMTEKSVNLFKLIQVFDENKEIYEDKLNSLTELTKRVIELKKSMTKDQFY